VIPLTLWRLTIDINGTREIGSWSGRLLVCALPMDMPGGIFLS
jgi:hypothetical protein